MSVEKWGTRIDIGECRQTKAGTEERLILHTDRHKETMCSLPIVEGTGIM